MDEKTKTSWENFLNPEALRPQLITACIYISAFELLKATIVDRIKDLFTNGFDRTGWRIDPKYQLTVLSKNRSPIYASLEWLKEANVIDDGDIAAFERVKGFRNELAHDLIGVLFRGLPPNLAERFSEMVGLLDKIERWWIVNFEIPINADLDGMEIDEAKVMPGPILGLRLLLDVALGSEKESKWYFEEFTKRTRPEV